MTLRHLALEMKFIEVSRSGPLAFASIPCAPSTKRSAARTPCPVFDVPEFVQRLLPPMCAGAKMMHTRRIRRRQLAAHSPSLAREHLYYAGLWSREDMFDMLVSAQGKEANARRQQRQQHYQTGGGRVIQASLLFHVFFPPTLSPFELIAGILSTPPHRLSPKHPAMSSKTHLMARTVFHCNLYPVHPTRITCCSCSLAQPRGSKSHNCVRHGAKTWTVVIFCSLSLSVSCAGTRAVRFDR